MRRSGALRLALPFSWFQALLRPGLLAGVRAMITAGAIGVGALGAGLIRTRLLGAGTIFAAHLWRCIDARLIRYVASDAFGPILTLGTIVTIRAVIAFSAGAAAAPGVARFAIGTFAARCSVRAFG